MGWSCAAKAAKTLDAVSKIMEERGADTSNGLIVSGKKYGFFESSRREYDDGRITGSVWRFLPDGEHVRRAGGFRINADGTIGNFPGLDKAAKAEAERRGGTEYERFFGVWRGNHGL